MFIILIMDSNKNTRITSKALYSVYVIYEKRWNTPIRFHFYIQTFYLDIRGLHLEPLHICVWEGGGGIKGKVHTVTGHEGPEGSRCRWVITAALQPLYPREGNLVPKCTGGWVGPRSILAGW